MITALIVVAALVLDARFGEPRHFHPLIGFGRVAKLLELCIYSDSRTRGVVALALLLFSFTLFIMLTRWLFPLDFLFDALLLYLAIGWHSLEQHARNVRDALVDGDLIAARQQVALMVSRDTSTLDPQETTKATLESALANGNDAIFAVIFWFIIGGAQGVVIYRLVNTLDAMWGYRNERYNHFGWGAARLDDLMNFIPARLTALGYALAGKTQIALRCWQKQGAYWKSPNAGPVMASGAGSLGLQLGGAASYHGTVEERPLLGEGRQPAIDDIDCALNLIRRTLLIWLLVLFLGAWFVW
ncbi:MAG: cobalamin biosynthesis protein [Gammaproteobacteria bacterium]|nr:cobalamin biosynthesis protein [Gammaproteobacteria bacterium]